MRVRGAPLLAIAAVLMMSQLSVARVTEAAMVTADPKVVTLERRLSAQGWPMAVLVTSADVCVTPVADRHN